MLTDPGRTLGKYQLIAEIARGGMGVVYLAMIQGPGGFNKLVVVKELKPELVEEPAFLTMFLDEARLAARLSHPNIVQTNEVGNDGDRYFMAMDYLDGRGLDQIRRRSKVAGFGLSVPMHLRVVCDMLSGLDYAHKLTDFDGSPLNIVHRDVSPQNVFVTFDGQVKLLDFGIAKANDSMYETHAGVVKGKVSYMSPEQGRGWKVDARADVFSAGVMLWEALTGKRMREGKNDQEKLWALVSNEIPRASEIKPWVPPELDEICARAMAWNRDERYPSAGAMQADLERYLVSTGMNVSAREVGSCVSELFREDRANTNSVIEAHIARLRGGPVREKLPVIDVASRAVGSPTPSGERAMTRPPFEPELRTSADTPSARLADDAVRMPSEPRRPVAPPRRDLRPVIVTAIAGVVVGVVVIFLVARMTHDASPVSRAEPAPPTPVVPTPAPTPPAPVVPPPPVRVQPTLIDVEIRVSPATATVSIDGNVVDGNPFSKQYPADTETHHIRAAAPGYVAKSVSLAFNANVTLDLSLERLPAPPPPPSPPPVATPSRPSPRPRQPEPTRKVEPARPPEPAAHAPEPAPAETKPAAAETKPAAGSDIDPTGGTKPRRTIDPNNPYGGGQ
ncbi:MAG TPA: serine/threonine-protein kinase [Kofleriaceae bacterium]|nr:serine/threonine-protein kinase [Kofleriaceae bacterium]